MSGLLPFLATVLHNDGQKEGELPFMTVGREVLRDEQASPNYRLRLVRWRRTGEESWEVVDAHSSVVVVTGLEHRDEALRIVRGWERLSQRIPGGLEGHIIPH